MVPKDRLAEWEANLAAYVLDTGLTLQPHVKYLQFLATATNGHTKQQRYLTFTKISASSQKWQGFDRPPFQIGMSC